MRAIFSVGPLVAGLALAVIALCLLAAVIGCDSPRRPCPPPARPRQPHPCPPHCPHCPPHRPHPWR